MNCPNCRTAVPPGSRFCNRCGNTIAATPPPLPPQQMYPPRTVQGQAAPAQPLFPPPGQFQPPAAAYEAPAPRKKPVLLLALILALMIGGVAGASFWLLKGGKNSVLAGKNPPAPLGPGVSQAPAGTVPPGPSVVSGSGAQPIPGAPVMSAPNQPNGMAPGLMIAPGSKPNGAPSVVAAPNPAVPNAPSVVAAPGQPTPSAPPVTGMRNTPAQPQPQQVRDHSDLDRYILWLKYVEQERAALRAIGETQSFRVIEGFYRTALGMADPDFDERTFERELGRTLQQTLVAVRVFRTNIIRTKPAVPSDCKPLDSFYMAAVDQESLATTKLMEAMARKDIGMVKSIGGRGVSNIDWNLGQANLQLKKVYEGRGLNQQFEISTGGDKSLLGGVMGLGGFGVALR